MGHVRNKLVVLNIEFTKPHVALSLPATGAARETSNGAGKLVAGQPCVCVRIVHVVVEHAQKLFCSFCCDPSSVSVLRRVAQFSAHLITFLLLP